MGNNIFNGTINNSGDIDVNLTNPADSFTMAGTLNMAILNGASFVATNINITGELNFVGTIPAVPASAAKTAGGVVTAGVPGTGTIGGDVVIKSGAVVNVPEGIAKFSPSSLVKSETGSTVNIGDSGSDAQLIVQGDAMYQGLFNLNGAGTKTVSGDNINFGSGAIVYADDGISQLASNMQTSFQGGASLIVNNTATVQLEGTTNFAPGSYLYNGGTIEVMGETSIDATGQTLSLNGGGATTYRVASGATFSLLADSYSPFGGALALDDGAEAHFNFTNPGGELGIIAPVDLTVGIDPLMIRVTNGSMRVDGTMSVTGAGAAFVMADDGITLGNTASFDVGAGSDVHFSAANIVHNGETIVGLGKVVFEGGVNEWPTNQTIDAAKVKLQGNQVIGDGATLTATGDVELDGGSITGGTGSKIALKGKIVEVKENTTISVDKIELLDEIELLDKLQVAANKTLQLS
ncbi:MAG: hypothetical protein R3C10_23970 [Pirellulales bacterium]